MVGGEQTSMNKKRIRKDLIAICSVLVSVSIFSLVYYAPYSGLRAAFPRIFALTVTVGLSVLVVYEVVWATIVLGLISIIGGIAAVVTGALRVSVIEGFVVVIIMGAFYIFAGIYMFVTFRKRTVDEESQ